MDKWFRGALRGMTQGTAKQAAEDTQARVAVDARGDSLLAGMQKDAANRHRIGVAINEGQTVKPKPAKPDPGMPENTPEWKARQKEIEDRQVRVSGARIRKRRMGG